MESWDWISCAKLTKVPANYMNIKPHYTKQWKHLATSMVFFLIFWTYLTPQPHFLNKVRYMLWRARLPMPSNSLKLKAGHLQQLRFSGGPISAMLPLEICTLNWFWVWRPHLPFMRQYIFYIIYHPLYSYNFYLLNYLLVSNGGINRPCQQWFHQVGNFKNRGHEEHPI